MVVAFVLGKNLDILNILNPTYVKATLVSVLTFSVPFGYQIVGFKVSVSDRRRKTNITK